MKTIEFTLSHLTDISIVEDLLHTAVANGRWCGVERPECGAPAAG